jgi:signal transduction histidine kinase
MDIENTGAGIPEAEQQSIFGEFRTGASADPRNGNGLGLYIVKTIVAAHQGTVQVKSELGAGVTLTVCFPVCQ